MEIRTIGNPTTASRPLADSSTVPQSVQNQASEQVSVQTVRAVPQVSEMERMGGTRRTAESQDMRAEQPDARQAQAQAGVKVSLPSVLDSARQQETKPENTASLRQQEQAAAFSGLREANAKEEAERTAPGSEEEAREAEKARAQQAADDISDVLASMPKSLNLSVDEDLGRVVVKVMDPETKEVIKQIPSEEALELAKSLSKMRGMFVETRA
ncbi:MAG: flagellar protein FlaG [Alistipes senegalensis]|nr:flagellar protein FlaG [Oxalobacter formigenes]MCM1281915.1 flagellar protein FlaG [Alistipes senegalensis]